MTRQALTPAERKALAEKIWEAFNTEQGQSAAWYRAVELKDILTLVRSVLLDEDAA